MTKAEHYRQQHIQVSALMGRLSNRQKLMLAQGLNDGWAVGDFGVDNYDPEPMDKVLAQVQGELAAGLGGSAQTPLAFWDDPEEDVYTAVDGDPIQS
jgi:hypothetical protein